MNKERLFELYEKLYFHEMEVRERITGRVQITFALVATGYTILSYMLRMLDYTALHCAIMVFAISSGLTFALSFVCLYFLVRAFWGNTYKGMPSPIKTDEYREKLIAHKKDIEDYNNSYPSNQQTEVDVDSLVADHLYQKFRDCSAHNTEVNDRRSQQLHRAFKWLLFASIPILVSSVTYIAHDLDVSSPRKETPIVDLSVATELNGIKTKLEVLNLSLKQGVKIVPEVEDNYVPPPPPPPQEPDARPLVEDNYPLPNAGE
jgi:Ca2+/Na+ antiporter